MVCKDCQNEITVHVAGCPMDQCYDCFKKEHELITSGENADAPRIARLKKEWDDATTAYKQYRIEHSRPMTAEEMAKSSIAGAFIGAPSESRVMTLTREQAQEFKKLHDVQRAAHDNYIKQAKICQVKIQQ